MARALLVHERAGSDWRPVAVLYGTPKRLDARVLPGNGARQAWVDGLLANAKPPFKDGVGISLERGTYEDWIGWALRSLGNGHDTWVTEVEADVTVEATYGTFVLGADTPLTNPKAATTDEVPQLSGFKKVKPA